MVVLLELIGFTILGRFNIFWIGATNMGMVFMGLDKDVHIYAMGGSQQ
jgi:hypothetical protein